MSGVVSRGSLISKKFPKVCIVASLFAATTPALAGGLSVYQVTVPEPSVLSLMAGGLATAVLLARAKNKK